jgi:hypothetical protein
MWQRRRFITLWASTACYRDSFTSEYHFIIYLYRKNTLYWIMLYFSILLHCVIWLRVVLCYLRFQLLLIFVPSFTTCFCLIGHLQMCSPTRVLQHPKSDFILGMIAGFHFVALSSQVEVIILTVKHLWVCWTVYRLLLSEFSQLYCNLIVH